MTQPHNRPAQDHGGAGRFKNVLAVCDGGQGDATTLDLAAEILGELKALQKEVPVFIITGWNKGDDALKDARAIADGIIQKPFNMDQIRLEMVKAIGKRRQFHRNGLSV